MSTTRTGLGFCSQNNALKSEAVGVKWTKTVTLRLLTVPVGKSTENENDARNESGWSLWRFWLFSSLLFPPPSRSRAPDRFFPLSIEQGLSQSDVYCIHQDKTGFLWFGTEDGLDRYDGTTFVVYRNDILNPASISFNNIKAIYEDREGMLWIGTDGGGLNQFDRRKERFLRFLNDPADDTEFERQCY